MYDVGVKRWLKIIRLVNMHKHLGHALAQSSLAAVLRALKTSAQVPGTQHLLRSCAMVLRLYVHIDETQSLFLAFDLYIICIRNDTHVFLQKRLRKVSGPALSVLCISIP